MEPDDPAAALNQVLSDVIDIVQDVKQAHRKVSQTHALHAELDALSEDLRSWARLLMERDEALGLSPLESIPSVAGRKPPNLWRGEASDEDVSRLIDDHLERLAQHVTAAFAAQDEERSRAALAGIEHELREHRAKFSAAG